MVGRSSCLLLGCLIKGCAGGCVVGPGWPSSPLADGEQCSMWFGTPEKNVPTSNIYYAAESDCDKVCASGACLKDTIISSAPTCGSFLDAGNGCTSNADCNRWDARGVDVSCRIPSVCESGQCKLGGSATCSSFMSLPDGGDSVCASGTCLASSLVMGEPRCDTEAGFPILFNCNANPTPAPTPALTPAPTAGHTAGPQHISGDPIMKINGHTVKIDFPFAESTLVWQDPKLQVFAKADVTTPDHKQSWFSDFIVFVHGRKSVHIQQKQHPVDIADTLAIMRYSAEKDDVGLTIEAPGKFDIGDGIASVFVSFQQQDGHLARKVVTVKSEGIHFSVVSQNATKFMPDVKKARKYSHLDISLQRMDAGIVQKGAFAELWGLIPMSATTARMIKKVRMWSS